MLNFREMTPEDRGLLQQALRDREERHSRVEKHDISDEQAGKNNAVLSALQKGDRVEVACYHAFHDVTLTGTLDGIDPVGRFLTVDGIRVFFTDIYAVTPL